MRQYKKKCSFCGKYYEGVGNNYCSQQCWREVFKTIGFQKGNKINLGIPKSEEHKKNIGLAKTKKIKNLHYSKLTPEKAYVLGVLCGDGSLHIRNNNLYITLTSIDYDFIEFFSSCLVKIYGLKPKTLIIKHKKINFYNGYTSYCKPQIRSTLHSKQVVLDLMEYDLTNEGFKTRTWRVPSKILESHDEQIMIMFIKGFFDSDGWCYVRKDNKYIQIRSCSISKGIFDLKKLFDFLGLSRITYNIRKNGQIYLTICNYHCAKIFYQKIGFVIKRKQDKLKKYFVGGIKSD